jgi:hypothetical protein
MFWPVSGFLWLTSKLYGLCEPSHIAIVVSRLADVGFGCEAEIVEDTRLEDASGSGGGGG